MKKIKLTQGQFAIVADEWHGRLMRRHAWEKCRKPVKWCVYCNPRTKSFYARRYVRMPNGKPMFEWMHRRILGLKCGDKRQGDHVNHKTLDNRPNNLRIVTPRGNSENMRNQSKYGAGISFNVLCRSRPFEARAYFDRKKRYIGMFATAEEARIARKQWLKNKKQK